MLPPFLVASFARRRLQVGIEADKLSLQVLKPEVISGMIIPRALPLLCLSFTIL
jgi:hypothetical protein